VTSNRLNHLIESWSEGSLTAGDLQELNVLLRSSPEARKVFQEAAALHGMLHAAANSLAIESADRQAMPITMLESSPTSSYCGWRNMIGVIVGMALGIVCVSTVWALASPTMVALSSAITTLNNASFEDSSSEIQRGFPVAFGQWGGDHVEVVKRLNNDATTGERSTRFVAAMADAGNPNSRAIACDLFQLVDLGKLQSTREKSSEVVLELSAKFLDARSYNSQPSVTFFCQIYLFRGNPQDIHEHWPDAIRDAISSGSAEVTTLGDSGWREITARCLVPDPVQFAVVHLAARPNLRVPMPDGLFVDQVELVAKTQPVLPVRDMRSE
jgi:hypothetical protein